eukprot:TRINITY_DN2578_c0_g1_i1.p1 TRINITY_DN2578_c0_g1~~TRINITY_DN2578_c0_g1_i1.p1  ORF type:complete len:260 (+),score=64.01 TRINITY_DN2578_c0_g1_i1:93-782(+)
MFTLLSKEPTIEDRAKIWTRDLKKQQRNLERDMNKLAREEEKIKLEIKAAAKKQQTKACSTLAKSLIKTRKVKDNLLEGKTRINSVILQMKTQLATMKFAKITSKCVPIMQSMQKLVSLPQIRETTTAMAREMTKAGIIDELIEDSVSALDDESLEKEAEEEVDAVLYELTKGELGKLPTLKTREKEKETQEEKTEQKVSKEETKKKVVTMTDAEKSELASMKARLESL